MASEFNTQMQFFENSKKRNIRNIFKKFVMIRKNLNIQNVVLINYEKCTWLAVRKPSISLGESAIILQTLSICSWI